MTPVRNLSKQAGAPMRCTLFAKAVVGATVEQLKTLRQNPAPAGSASFPPATVKNSDDQSVAALAAVLRAIHDYGLKHSDFTHWGVLAAPHFLARAIVAQALQRFAAEGAWGVSPHLIPHRSLHSVSGTISQALGIHGPNLGVGGGPQSASKAFLAAAAMLSDERIPGVWLVVTGWNWEPGVEGSLHRACETAQAAACCSAVALALQRANTRNWLPQLWINPRQDSLDQTAANGVDGEEAKPFLSMERLCAAARHNSGPHLFRWQLHCGGTLAWQVPQVAMEKSA